MAKIFSFKNTASIFTGFIIFLLLAAGIAVFIILKFGKQEIPAQPEQENAMEEILQSLTAPSAGAEVSKKTLQSLSAPKKGKTPSEEIIENLTAPNK